MIRATFLILAGLLTANAAAAATVPFTATLAQPVKRIDVIADSNLFRCEGTSCKLTSKPVDANSVNICHRLARQVGEITAYGPEGTPFSADQLKSCNAK